LVSEEEHPAVTSGELRLAAMDLLARREHGSQELLVKLRQRFRRRTCSDEQVLDVLTALTDEGLLSDERFALSTVRQLVSRGYGPRRITETFRQQGIEGYLSRALATAFDGPIDWYAEAASAYQKKYQGDAIMGDWDARQRERAKRMRFLQYRGFDAEVCQALVFDGPTADELTAG
jgi:regulatory protein